MDGEHDAGEENFRNKEPLTAEPVEAAEHSEVDGTSCILSFDELIDLKDDGNKLCLFILWKR